MEMSLKSYFKMTHNFSIRYFFNTLQLARCRVIILAVKRVVIALHWTVSNLENLFK